MYSLPLLFYRIHYKAASDCVDQVHRQPSSGSIGLIFAVPSSTRSRYAGHRQPPFLAGVTLPLSVLFEFPLPRSLDRVWHVHPFDRLTASVLLSVHLYGLTCGIIFSQSSFAMVIVAVSSV